MFFAKRLLIASLLITENDFLWVNVAALNFIALGSNIFHLWYMPLDSRKANLLEVFNDCTLLMLTYLLWCFTDIVGEPETREQLGYVFISVSLGNIAVHILMMLCETGFRVKLSYKKCMNKRKAKSCINSNKPQDAQVREATSANSAG